MKRLFALLCAAQSVAGLAATYVSVEFIQTDGYAYIDTGIAGNAKKVQQKALLQFLDVPTSMATVPICGSYGSGGMCSYTSCALCLNKEQIHPYYSGGGSSGYYFNSPAKNVWYDFYLHHGYCNNYDNYTAYNPATGVGYNWDSLKDVDFSTLLIGNVHTADGELYATPGTVIPMRWYSYEAIDHDTGASLIKLTPAKCVETGEFGMLDSVNGGFYTSPVEGHPIIGPAEVSFEAGKTYDGNALLVVPAGEEVVVDNANLANIRMLGAIRLTDASSTLTISNLTSAQSFLPRLSGKGVFKHVLGAAQVNLSMCGDCRGFEGSYFVTNAQIYISNKYALGTTNRVDYMNFAGSHFFFGSGHTFDNEFHFRGNSGQRLMPDGRFTFRGPFIFEMTTSGEFHGYGSEASGCGICIVGFVTNALPESTVKINQSHYLYFHPSNECYLGKLHIKTTSHTKYGGRIHTTTAYSIWANPQDYANIGCSSGASINFDSANVFDDDILFLFGHGYTSNPTPGGTMDLNGFDQRIGRLITGVGGTVTTETRPQATSLQITSATPATLKICNTTVFGHNPYPDRLPGCYPGRVNGAASVDLDTASTIASPGIISFTCAGSDTTGGLSARRGTVKFYETCTFSNLTELVASGEGQIDLGTSEIGNAANLCVALTNATLASGKVPLTIAADCTLDAYTAVVTLNGQNKWLEPGDYTASDLPTLIGGDGTLHVRKYGGKKGVILFIR